MKKFKCYRLSRIVNGELLERELNVISGVAFAALISS